MQTIFLEGQSHKNFIPDNNYVMKKDNDAEEEKLLEIKKELILKDYDSLFIVYARETEIVFSFRSWTITLHVAYFGFLLISTLKIPDYAYFIIPFFIIFFFLILEAAERSIMDYLVEDLRKLETMFMEPNLTTLKQYLMKYEFRDIRDKNQKTKARMKYFIKTFITPQILSWYPMIIAITVIIVVFITRMNTNAT